MSTEPAPQFDPVKYKETTREQWQTAAEPWYRWASLAEDVAPGRVWHAGRLRRPRMGRGFVGRAVEAPAQAQANGAPSRACGGQPDGCVRR
jgi:hypothetical protein